MRQKHTDTLLVLRQGQEFSTSLRVDPADGQRLCQEGFGARLRQYGHPISRMHMSQLQTGHRCPAIVENDLVNGMTLRDDCGRDATRLKEFKCTGIDHLGTRSGAGDRGFVHNATSNAAFKQKQRGGQPRGAGANNKGIRFHLSYSWVTTLILGIAGACQGSTNYVRANSCQKNLTVMR